MNDLLKDGGAVVFGLLKTKGVPEVLNALEKLSTEATEDWQKSLLKIGVNLVSEHGPDGLNLLEDLVSNLQGGKSVDLSGLSMQEASDLLATMQRKEADTRNDVNLYTQVIIETLGKALSTLVSILFKEIKL